MADESKPITKEPTSSGEKVAPKQQRTQVATIAIQPKHIPGKFFSNDENVLFESRPSAWFWMKGAALAMLVAIVAAVLSLWKWAPEELDIPYVSPALSGENGDLVQLAFAAIAVIAFIVFIARWLRWTSTVYAATDERIIMQMGILNKTYSYIPVTMIEDIRLTQSLIGRWMGWGTLRFSTGGLGGMQGSNAKPRADMVWRAVPGAMEVERKLQEVMDIRVKPAR